jgi:putative NADPH-quinone reductase
MGKGLKVLIIDAHPAQNSFVSALADAYQKGAQANKATVHRLNLRELAFDLSFEGYKSEKELKPDIIKAQELLKWSEHIVLVYPNWWGTYPALLKGFLDRTLLPGFAFKFRENTSFWDKLLKGRSARLLVTMDTPSWYYTLFWSAPGHRSMRNCILGFCGIQPIKITSFSTVRNSTPEKRNLWLKKAEELGFRWQ